MENQLSLFNDCGSYDIESQIKRSKEIYARAVLDYKPYATVLMLSGGRDSVSALVMCQILGIKPDYVIHGITGTGLKEVLDYVKYLDNCTGFKFHYANAGNSYQEYVLRNGFMGLGLKSHAVSYHLLKNQPFSKAISILIRQKKHNRKVLLLNGARRNESIRRKKTMLSPFRVQRSNVWVNIINDLLNEQTTELIEGSGKKVNPVYKVLCKSGECLCGTLCKREEELSALKHAYRYKYDEIISLENAVLKKGLPWGWGQKKPAEHNSYNRGSLELFPPACASCTAIYSEENQPQKTLII